MGWASQNRALLAALVIGGSIAAITPFDLAFDAVTLGNSFLRAIMLVTLGVAGWLAASKVGLRVESHGARPILIGLAAALLVALYVAAVDGFIFRETLPPQYVQFLQLPLLKRSLYFMLRAFNENILYRLFVFSFFVLALKRLRLISPATTIAAMFLSQSVNIWINVAAIEQLSTTVLIYDVIRYVLPGMVWSWLYLRFGLMTAEIGAVGCHGFLQPMFSVIF